MNPIPFLLFAVLSLTVEGVIFGDELTVDLFEPDFSGGFFSDVGEVAGLFADFLTLVVNFVTLNIDGAPWWIRVPFSIFVGGSLLYSITIITTKVVSAIGQILPLTLVLGLLLFAPTAEAEQNDWDYTIPSGLGGNDNIQGTLTYPDGPLDVDEGFYVTFNAASNTGGVAGLQWQHPHGSCTVDHFHNETAVDEVKSIAVYLTWTSLGTCSFHADVLLDGTTYFQMAGTVSTGAMIETNDLAVTDWPSLGIGAWPSLNITSWPDLENYIKEIPELQGDLFQQNVTAGNFTTIEPNPTPEEQLQAFLPWFFAGVLFLAGEWRRDPIYKVLAGVSVLLAFTGWPIATVIVLTAVYLVVQLAVAGRLTRSGGGDS